MTMTRQEFATELAKAARLLDDNFNADTTDPFDRVCVGRVSRSPNGFMCTCTANVEPDAAFAMMEFLLRQQDDCEAFEPIVGHA